SSARQQSLPQQQRWFHDNLYHGKQHSRDNRREYRPQHGPFLNVDFFSHIHTKIIDIYSSKSKIINFAPAKINIMSDIPVLISDLAIILFSAGLITILFKWLKQPVV